MKNQSHLYLLNIFFGRRLWETDVYKNILSILSQNGLNVSCPKIFNVEDRIQLNHNLQSGDVVIAHQPQISIKNKKVNGFCEPQKLYNRSSRMTFLDNIGFPTMKWINGTKVKSLSELFELWETNIVLYKKNNSFQSKGIKLLNSNSKLPDVKNGDLFCPIITENPYTYKVDFFHNKILGSYIKQTPSVLNENYFDWIHGDNKDQLQFPNQNRSYFYLPFDIKSKIINLGKKITHLGGGYSSIDLMKTSDGYKAIELNISEIATKYTWLTRPVQYSKNFSKAILNLCNDYDLIK